MARRGASLAADPRRPRDREARALAGLRIDAARAVMGGDDVSRDGQAEARPLPVAAPRAVRLPEAFEDPRHVIGEDADSRVRDTQLHLAVDTPCRHCDRAPG